MDMPRGRKKEQKQSHHSRRPGPQGECLEGRAGESDDRMWNSFSLQKALNAEKPVEGDASDWSDLRVWGEGRDSVHRPGQKWSQQS